MRALVVLLLVVILGLTGCVSIQRDIDETESQSLEPALLVKFGDIPTPTGFKILPRRSFILESGGIRAGVLRYVGRADADKVLTFYKTQMPMYNWALLNVLEYGDRMLNFERQNESCVITIKPSGMKTEISVSLAPKTPMAVAQQ